MYTKPGSDGLQFLDDIVYYRLSYGERRADQHPTLVRNDQSYGVVGGLWTACDEVDPLLPAVPKRSRRGAGRRMVVEWLP
jgi:hypothetical protein